ncbi:MAG: S8 family serine peptidase [Candidatus Sericytochromatia bacterium]|nr:S8 family serine peptidase [Candidatus Tanganyikabacteria bacterium]
MSKTRGMLLSLVLAAAGCGTPARTLATPDLSWQVARPAEAAPIVAPPVDDQARAVPGEVVIRFKDGTYADDRAPEIAGAEALRPVEGVPGAWVYRMTGGKYTTANADTLRNDPRLEYAEPNYRYHIVESEVAYSPPGEDLSGLWGVRQIKAPDAWDRTRGKSSVLIAVIDTGVDYRHPDLEGIVVKGPDVTNGDNDPRDDHGHGTHVAGTIAARANGAGVVGVAFGAKILAIKALDRNGSGPEDGIARAVDAAVRNGAKIINMSLGGPEDARALRDAVARAHRQGVLVVVAAGNDASTRASYPAAYPDALAVGATDSRDRRAYFSNYGSYTQIAAPGVGVLSTSLGGDYERLSGTSMAAPHVAGAAALLLSANGGLSPAALKKALIDTGDAAQDFPYTPKVRRLNVVKALAAAGQGGTSPTPDPGPGDPGSPQGISGITIVKRSVDGATIKWHTDVPTMGFVEYGPSKEYGATTFYSDGYKTDHEMSLSGLKRWKWYYFRVHGRTQDGRQYVSEGQEFLTKLWFLFSVAEH